MGPSPLQRSLSFPCLLYLILSIAPLADAAPIALDEYRSRIRESIELIQTGDDCIPSDQSALLRARFPRVLLITNRGQISEVDCELLGRWIEEAERSAEGRAHLLTHMNGLLDQISCEPRSSLSWGKCRSALEAVFNLGEFRDFKESEPPAWKAWLMERLRRIMERLRLLFGNVEGKTLAWTSMALLGVIVVAGLILIFWAVRSTGRIGWRWRRPVIRQPKSSEEKVPVDWNSLRSEAEKKAEQGELREAVRALFLSVLLEGHSKGWWVYRPESTNTEHLLRIAGPSERKDAFRSLAEIYEKSWYGLKAPGRDDFAICRKWVERMGTA